MLNLSLHCVWPSTKSLVADYFNIKYKYEARLWIAHSTWTQFPILNVSSHCHRNKVVGSDETCWDQHFLTLHVSCEGTTQRRRLSPSPQKCGLMKMAKSRSILTSSRLPSSAKLSVSLLTPRLDEFMIAINMIKKFKLNYG